MAPRYEDTLQYLWGLRRLGAKSDLTVIRAILASLGNPQRSFPSIHITGSKGKGSTAALCAAVLHTAGYRTGLYTSPHMLSYRERTVVDGVPIPKETVVDLVELVRETSASLLQAGTIDREPTFFEITTAVAFAHFKREHVQAGVIEVGLGGRLDATNTIDAPVCAITTLELEHTEILGPTLTDIAREKAGILHPGTRLVTGVDAGEGLQELERVASGLRVPTWRIGSEIRVERTRQDRESQVVDVQNPLRHHTGLRIPLLGGFQVLNAGVAVSALDRFAEATGLTIPEEAYHRGLAQTLWPGRLERLSEAPCFYADAAHTEMSARALTKSMLEIEPDAPRNRNVVLFSCLRDKRMGAILEEFSRLADTIVLTELRNDRAMPVKEMERAARGRFSRILVAPQIPQALELARAAVPSGGFLLATGSTYLISEVEAAVKGVSVEEPRLSDPLPTTASGAGIAGRTRRSAQQV